MVTLANTATKSRVCFKTIYRWLYKNKLEGATVKNLRLKGKKRTCRNLALYSKGTPIRKRPKEVHKRTTLGHWELDTVVSGRDNKDKVCFATFIKQKARLYIAKKYPTAKQKLWKLR